MNLMKVDQQFYRIDTATVNLVRFTNDGETDAISLIINIV
jgi:hypothetical protein